MSFDLIFEKSKQGRRGYLLPAIDVPEMPLDSMISQNLLRAELLPIPEIPEVEVVRHYVGLSHRNYSVDTGFYPLGSCTMKYNPKINEEVAKLSGFLKLHPFQSEQTAQGILKLMYELTWCLSEITGMAWGSLQPYAGAHGEFTGMKMFRGYFKKKNEMKRDVIIVPDSAHGTNPASAHIAGFRVVEISSDRRGMIAADALRPHLGETLAGIMLTNPNTLGLFEEDIKSVANLIHRAGGLLYYDGANLNPILGKCRPGDMGFDVVHLNLHKTFSTPHGGGGPGAGPVFVTKQMVPFLPEPVVNQTGDGYSLVSGSPDSIGSVSSFYGNIGVLIRAYAYLLSMGGDGLEGVANYAVLNANYLRARLKGVFDIPYGNICKHEFVMSARKLKEQFGVSAMDVAKRLLDHGIHPPTVYFPLIVAEALMVEPTETETKETLDDFVEVLMRIRRTAEENPRLVQEAPHATPVRRLDEVRAARHPVLRWR